MLGSEDIPRAKLLPIQIDFSIDGNITELRRMLSRIVGEEAILFSLLGNTLANFENDTELLRTVSALLRPQDRLLLELASTTRVDADAAGAAADEYARSAAFKQFVTSALLGSTDLPAGIETVSFTGLPEGERAILIKAIYQNRENRTMPMKLPDNTTINFVPNDTIRLLISRKYADGGIAALTADCGLSAVVCDRSLQTRDGFGLDLVLSAVDTPVNRQT